eukprot:Lithocolla_globosa_v1_NODE_7025_length_1004_cov_3.590095.p2 type:complete len:109 gc:universal NODE_7025_length_1004_cov_3.590095:525-851(+)
MRQGIVHSFAQIGQHQLAFTGRTYMNDADISSATSARIHAPTKCCGSSHDRHNLGGIGSCGNARNLLLQRSFKVKLSLLERLLVAVLLLLQKVTVVFTSQPIAIPVED